MEQSEGEQRGEGGGPPPAGEVIAVCRSAARGIPKLPQAEVTLRADFGVEEDRHGGSRSRQVSLLEAEVLEALREMGMAVAPGVLGENITTRGLRYADLRPGDRLRAGAAVVLEVMEPRTPCKTLTPVDARLPQAIEGRAGLLCRVAAGGVLRPGDGIARE